MQTEIKTVQRLFAIMLTADIDSIFSDYNRSIVVYVVSHEIFVLNSTIRNVLLIVNGCKQHLLLHILLCNIAIIALS